MANPAKGLLPGDRPINVDIAGGDGVPAIVEITFADGERLLLRAIRYLSPRDRRVLMSLANR